MRKRIWELDALRGLCILGMVLVHLVYDIRDLLDSSVCLLDGRSPLDLAPFSAAKKPLVHFIHGTVLEKLLRDHGVLQEE